MYQIMARFRRNRGMALRPVQRIKHVVDSQATLALNTVLPTVVIVASDAPTLSLTKSVQTGSKIYGIYLRVEVASNDAQVSGAVPNVYMIVAKNPGGNLTLPNPNSVGSSDNKRFVIHQEMVMIQNVVSSNPRTLFNGVIAIPRGYSRFGPNDELTVSILSPAIDISLCMQVHFKEFR